ncbi:MAG TPA: hypothetical protein VFP84_15785 [Kofleriaceae bacterium]|nr:hypothetical protein [Kofleriaceae bacterium]
MTASNYDFASAALRHIRDAEHLATEGEHISRDQAWHLAGFAHECARKAPIYQGWIPKMLGHDFQIANELVIEFAIAFDPRANRFPLANWSKRFPAISAWSPEHRYEPTGALDNASDRCVEDLIAQGRAAVDECILALFLDGFLATESLR